MLFFLLDGYAVFGNYLSYIISKALLGTAFLLQLLTVAAFSLCALPTCL